MASGFHTQILLLVRAAPGYTPIFVAGGVCVGGEASKRLAGILALDEGKAAVFLCRCLPTVREGQASSCHTGVVVPSSPTTLFFHALDLWVSS